MPIIFQQTSLPLVQIAVWHISEPLSFFEQRLPAGRVIEHPQVRARHLAARHLLQQLRPDFSLDRIVVSQSGKPFVDNGEFHFSLTHCSNYAGVIVSEAGSVGIDLEQSGDRIFRIRHKFLSDADQELLLRQGGLSQLQEGQEAACWLTRCWSAKESVYKWYGESGVDFREHIRLEQIDLAAKTLRIAFTPTEQSLLLHYTAIQGMELTWVQPLG
jgi:phosphopantetheinyl transferase